MLSGVNITRLTAEGRVSGSDIATAVCSVTLSAGVDAAHVRLYKGISASGTPILDVKAALATTQHIDLPCPVAGDDTGDFFVEFVAGTAPTASVSWK